MIYIIIIPILLPLLTFLVILSHNLAKADNDKMVDELTEMLRLEEWQVRVLREYLKSGRC